jgi:hypothetical protein
MIGGIIDIADFSRRMDNRPNVSDIPSGGQWEIRNVRFDQGYKAT